MNKTLYVHRPVLNYFALTAWFGNQNVFIHNPETLHVTVAYSKRPVNWDLLEQDTEKVFVEPRFEFDLFGTCLVMKMSSQNLLDRWEYFMRKGCSFDFTTYHPHVTINYVWNGDHSTLKPFPSRLILGNEIFEEVNEIWQPEKLL